MKPGTCWCSEMKVNSRFRVKWFQQVRSWMTCQSFIDMNKMKRLFWGALYNDKGIAVAGVPLFEYTPATATV